MFRERGGTDRPRMVLVVWDVDHHDDAMNRARRIHYDNLAAVLHEEGILEEMSISKLPEYPWVPVDVVEKEVGKGKGVLNQYVRLQYRGEDWWMEQATRWEQESLADAHEFFEIDVERIEQELAHIAQNDEDFLLHLLPEQMQFVRAEGPLLLSGTVGSGKTTVMLYHLYRQARTNPNGQYLVVTYSPNLSNLCQLLFERLPGGRDLLERVSILSFTQLLKMINRGAHIISYDARRRQFEEAYAEVGRRWKMKAIPKPLHNFRQKHPTLPWHLEALWAEYWDVIKGQLNWATRGLLDREGYLQYAATRLTPEEREAVFSVYEQWFTQLPGMDELDACRQIWREQEFSGLRYRFDGVYVDEAQDLCEVQWMILLQMVKSPTGLFLTADPFQALRPSGFHWNRLERRLQSEIAVQDASLGINRRNSRQIASLVQREMERVSQRLGLEEKPNYHVTAVLDSLPPAGAPEQQIDPPRLAEWLGDQGALVIPDDSARNHPLAQQIANSAPVVTVEECKGLEFDRVAVLGMYAHLEEAKRERAETLRQLAFSQWYVAMTRARRGLLVIEPEAQLLPTGLTVADEVWFGTWRDVEEVVVRSVDVLRARSAERYEDAGEFVVAARCYEQTAQFDKAAECYEKAGQFSNAAECYEQAERFDRAGVCYEQAGQFGKAAQCYEQAGQFSKAAQCYEQAGQFDNAGVCYEKAGQFGQAAECYEQAGQFGKAAQCYERAQQFDKAAQCYEKAQMFADADRCRRKARRWWW